jgi:hypothetical protein
MPQDGLSQTVKIPQIDSSRHVSLVNRQMGSPESYEYGTGKMSPLSKVKEMLKGDVDRLKERANKSFFKHLDENSAKHYE